MTEPVTYVMVEIGCTHCVMPSRLVAVTHDLVAAQSAWDRYWADGRDPRPWGVQPPWAGDEPWPDNVVSLDQESGRAVVVFAHTPDSPDPLSTPVTESEPSQ
jgi:hypothetical protein